ncbi:MAG: flavin-dependent oxidoreductase, partial [Stellaceae bacterium]
PVMMRKKATTVAIVGGGIAGLGLALNLRRRGVECTVYESASAIKELGVGITLLPHAMRELSALGLQDALRPLAIENAESRFFNRFGQLIYKEPRGLAAGYRYPEFGIHRGRLHRVMYEAACAALGADRIVLNRQCIGVDQDAGGVTLRFREASTGAAAPEAVADIAVACDGINSAVRRQFYPDERAAFAGINTWRGVTRRPPILGGRTYMRIGSIRTGKLVVYPIVDKIDGHGNQLINWMAEIQGDRLTVNDWNKPGRLADFFPLYRDWTFDWLDVAALLRNAETILEYPMVDKDPVGRWTFGRVTLAGDAAHPMYPRGSNGAAQALIDVRTLAELLAAGDPVAALNAYEVARLEPTARIVRTNREHPPDFINIRVEELTGDRPFDNLDDFITQDELRALSENYRRIAGFAVDAVAR